MDETLPPHHARGRSSEGVLEAGGFLELTGSRCRVLIVPTFDDRPGLVVPVPDLVGTGRPELARAITQNESPFDMFLRKSTATGLAAAALACLGFAFINPNAPFTARTLDDHAADLHDYIHTVVAPMGHTSYGSHHFDVECGGLESSLFDWLLGNTGQCPPAKQLQVVTTSFHHMTTMFTANGVFNDAGATAIYNDCQLELNNVTAEMAYACPPPKETTQMPKPTSHTL